VGINVSNWIFLSRLILHLKCFHDFLHNYFSLFIVYTNSIYEKGGSVNPPKKPFDFNDLFVHIFIIYYNRCESREVIRMASFLRERGEPCESNICPYLGKKKKKDKTQVWKPLIHTPFC
jgi:hypothetical protein